MARGIARTTLEVSLIVASFLLRPKVLGNFPFISFQVLIYLLIRQNGNWRGWNDKDAHDFKKKCFRMSGMKDVGGLDGRKTTALKSARVVSPACFAGVRKVVKYGHSVVEKVRVCRLSFTVSGTCSETSWLDGNLLSCGKIDIATRIVRSRFREAFSPVVYSPALWCF